jgi:hypothetical protein
MKPYLSRLYSWLVLLIICGVLLIGCRSSSSHRQSQTYVTKTPAQTSKVLLLSGNMGDAIDVDDTVCSPNDYNSSYMLQIHWASHPTRTRVSEPVVVQVDKIMPLFSCSCRSVLYSIAGR